MTDKTAVTTAFCLLRMCSTIGFPKVLQSDNGTEFVNDVIVALTENSGIDHRLITPYHPQANGVAERFVQTVKRLIIKMTDGKNSDWDVYAPSTQYFINCKVTARTGSTAFTMMLGRTPNGFKNYEGTVDLSQPFDWRGYLNRLQQLAPGDDPEMTKQDEEPPILYDSSDDSALTTEERQDFMAKLEKTIERNQAVPYTMYCPIPE